MTDRERLDKLFDSLYEKIGSFRAEAWCTAEPLAFGHRTEGRHLASVRPGERWGEGWDCAWMKLEAELPDNTDGTLVMLLDVGGEACLFDEEGRALKGFTNVQSEFTVALGKPGKVCWFLPRTGARKACYWADCGANDLFGAKPENGVFVRADAARCDTEKRALYYDLDVLLSLAETGNAEAKALFDRAMELTDDPAAARALVTPFLQCGEGKGNPIHAIGNAHIDLAWLWPMRETRRKAVRTLATVCDLMERYPAYTFAVSQPQMLVWVKEDAPELYDRVFAYIREGRIEVLGGMWVEPDVNLPSGESLVRQILYGMDESERVYGARQDVLVLPDTFGYNAQLPQLIRKAGMHGFLTTKMSWNGVNQFPFTSFLWRGIDGSEVVSHIPPEGNYNSAALPASMKKAKGDGKTPSAMLYGIGDGGGGPGMEHVERVMREKKLPGMPPVKNGTVAGFFEELHECRDALPLWQGELYLEKHQGVYTTYGKLKSAMAKCEKVLADTEFVASLVMRLAALPDDYRETIDRLWKKVLLMQFHDILPGSCIRRAMEESLAELENLYGEICSFKETLRAKLVEPASRLCEFHTEPLGIHALSILPQVMRYKVLPTEQTDDYMQNASLRVDFDGNGAITQITDRQTGETFLRGKAELRFYEDDENAWEVPDVRGKAYAAWEMCDLDLNGDERYYRLKNGENSMFVTVRLDPTERRLSFTVEAERFPDHTLAKWVFPLRHRSGFAKCGIQFGDVLRPTTANHSHDSAMKEVPFRDYVDISDDAFGAAILSGERHGVSVKDCELGISLQRSPDYPAWTDGTGTKSRFAFFPHGKEDVLPEAAAYTNPVEKWVGEPVIEGTLFDVSPLCTTAIKPTDAMDGSVILRCYNPKNSFLRVPVRIHPGLGLKTVEKTDLRENPVETVVEDGTISVAPYEIVTLRLKP